MTTRALGKRPAKFDNRTLRFARYRAAEQPGWEAPSSADYISLPGITWGMLGNDRAGDCTFATAGHSIQLWTRAATGRQALVTTEAILRAYSDLTGYDPLRPETDSGAYCLDVLNYWRQQGIAGHRILSFVAVDIKNHDEVCAAIDLFGSIYVGIGLPTSADAENAHGQTWAKTTDEPWSWGGHAINVGGYDSVGPLGITWGEPQKMTWGFWDTYVDEAYAVLSADWLTDGHAPNEFDIEALEKDLAAIVADTPLVGPTPIPAPPSTQTFVLSDELAGRIHHAAARARLDDAAWMENHLRRYFKMKSPQA
jgi:hypothetical protein